VTFAVMLCLVPIGLYGLTSLLLSIFVAVTWSAGLDRMCSRSEDFLILRLLPPSGAALLTLTVVLPAFLIHEPAHELEKIGPCLVAFVLLALITVGAGIVRAWRALVAARALLRSWPPVDSWSVTEGQTVYFINIPEPIVAVVGGWRPRIIAAKHVFGACTPEEFRQVMAHEAAHVSTQDNLKLLLLVASPDALAWLPCAAALAARWREAAEIEADERATGSDPRKRVALASALIKVARLSTGADRPLPALSMPIALDDVEGRVRRLLSPAPNTSRIINIKGLMACATLVPVIAVPFYGFVHQFIEALVSFGH
jgi:Zn-dependent protease with chaperone function